MAIVERTSRSDETTVVFTSMLAILVGSVLGFLFGFINPLLRADLDISRAQVGLVIGLYFGATGVGSVWAGALADRLGAKWSVALDMAIVMVAATTIAAIGSFAALVVGSLVAGFGYALANAGTNIAVAATVGPRRRAFALSIKTAGVPIQVALGSALAPALGERFGWRPVVGFVAVLAAGVLIMVVAVLPRAAVVEVAAGTTGRPLPAGFLWFPTASFLFLVGSQPFQSWLIPFLDEEVGASLTRAGLLAAAGAVVGVVGMLVLARRADMLGARARFIARLSFIAVLATVALWSGVYFGLWVVLFAAMAINALQLGAIGTLHAAVVDAAPDAVGRASGVTMTGYYLGALLAPLLFGWVVDLTDSFTAAWGICAVAFLAAGGAFVQADRVSVD